MGNKKKKSKKRTLSEVESTTVSADNEDGVDLDPVLLQDDDEQVVGESEVMFPDEPSVRDIRLGDDSFASSGQQSEISDAEDDSFIREADPGEYISYKVLPKGDVILGMKHRNQFFFKGCLNLKVLKGEVCVQGYRIQPSDNFISVYSPRGHSLLSISATSAENEDDSENDFSRLGIEKCDIINCDVVFLLQKLTESWMDYLLKNMKKNEKIRLFGRDNTKDEDKLSEMEKCLDITIYRPDKISTKLWKIGQDWEVALTSLQIVEKSGEQPRLVAIGGKGVGKSSFLRWLSNQLLTHKEILFLDLDPGQREFGLPGYMSLSLLNHPLLGPNFCHPASKWEKRVFFGDINVSNNPGRYLKCVKHLLKLSKEFHDLPMLVNTMGWCQGLGFQLNTDIIRLCNPTTVVQLHSRFPRKNFPKSLTADAVNSVKSSRTDPQTTLSYTLLEFLAVPERIAAKDMRSKDCWGIPEAKILRDIQTIAWLGRNGDVKDLPVYSISFSQICLNVAHEKVPDRGLLAALLLKPVDLCRVPTEYIRQPKQSENYSVLDKSPVTESLGTGFVRGVDGEERLIFVATSLKEEQLRSVNCLVGGCLSLPSGLVTKQKPPAPYLTDLSTLTPLDLPWQRNHKYGQFAK